MFICRTEPHTNPIPKRETPQSAAVDLRAIADVVIPAKCGVELVRTGFAVNLVGAGGHANTVGMVCSRSGLALKHKVFVLNAPGLVDSDYRGEVGVILCNMGDTDFHVEAGDRIAQFLPINYPVREFMEVSNLPDTERGSGGFGSTGVK